MSLVLVADDEPAVLEVLSQVVEDLGHEVLQARDGAEALRLARARRPQLVVTDHVMPRCSGLELCRALRREPGLEDVPVILLSGVLAQGAPEAHAFLQKPFEIDEFEAVLRAALAQVEGTGADAALPGAAHEPDSTWGAARALEGTLAAARSQLERLQGSGADGAALQALSAQLGQMEVLVRGLQGAAGLEPREVALRPVNGDLGAHLRGVLSAWRERAPFAQLHLSAPDEAVPARFDPERLRQALDALLDRAVHAGGPVEIRLQTNSALATIQVRDEGPAVSAEELPRLFERPRAEGAHTGLSAAAQIVRLHGGAISADCTPERGSAFSVLLPRTGPSRRAGNG
ncbi:hybrid sensor histidine kinase/response regulator [Aggregicoccus sp. 17bor-14]|uniref:ATP-binding response regulator n=1 Tax=Myxococcaceae TaxID=31 RepID=UPI00129CAE49|nr:MULTISPECIES: response regulator [Myxococcaceae]MBF5044215.1 response regulator [Simulacricoccus sp. 17bor-14]MRI89965.1 hybrid sensor histidine kinase/response regulator [Aggregicoccus sp. 17bor-14]